jgi:hypothetical protein
MFTSFLLEFELTFALVLTGQLFHVLEHIQGALLALLLVKTETSHFGQARLERVVLEVEPLQTAQLVKAKWQRDELIAQQVQTLQVDQLAKIGWQ